MKHNPFKKLKTYIPFAALPIILLVCFWLWGNLYEERPITTPSGNGTWDLRGVNFDGAFASLHGPVEAIPGVLSPEEFAALEDEAKLVYPRVGDKQATVRVRIFVSEDKEYLISRTSTGYSDRIYVNGQWLADSEGCRKVARLTGKQPQPTQKQIKEYVKCLKP